MAIKELSTTEVTSLVGTRLSKSQLLIPARGLKPWHDEFVRLLYELEAVCSGDFKVWEEASPAMSIRVSPGRCSISGAALAYAGGTADLAAFNNDVAYIWIYNNAGVATIGTATDATGWPAVAHIQLAEVTLAGGVITAILDRRMEALFRVTALLDAIAALTPTDGNIIVGDGTTWVAESGATARTSLGLGSIATQAASAVAITGGTIAGITDLAVADGGTGASDAATARTNLGLGTIATQAASAVAITGGTIAGITDLAVADGGTGASTAAAARANLGAAASGNNADITQLSGLANDGIPVDKVAAATTGGRGSVLQAATDADTTDLTDNSGGTSGGGTVAAIGVAVTNPADTPVDADALRDDLVTNTIPSIETELVNLRNAVATLAAYCNNLKADVNDLKAKLRTAGQLAT